MTDHLQIAPDGKFAGMKPRIQAVLNHSVTADTFQTALDEAIEKITRQIVRNKTKLKKIVYSGEPDVSEPAEDEEEYNIKIVKTFDMHPMTSDEAILRMNLLDHSFFMYLNAETGKYNVVYLRDDGDYGIIEPM